MMLFELLMILLLVVVAARLFGLVIGGSDRLLSGRRPDRRAPELEERLQRLERLLESTQDELSEARRDIRLLEEEREFLRALYPGKAERTSGPGTEAGTDTGAGTHTHGHPHTGREPPGGEGAAGGGGDAAT